ncbi:purine-nucleoside phosphorylase [Desertimonas flava]|uniref:phosphorylase family protein n=1 Tax=Desertimonas flava TaxID=2064846 RepID=UPI000E3440A4|nr:purine-nucleoside phosphorylase [Desertimonas flava]
MPIHLRADAGDYAPAVLCPGDPRRATYIAETFFDAGARLVNEERGMLGYTGTFEGRPISVQSTGMGCPSAGIVYEELVQLGVTRMIRVGTCGAIADGLQMADTVVAVSASAVDTTALQYAGMNHAPTATFSLATAAMRASSESGARTHAGAVITSALFYDPDETNIATWKRLGHLAIEMEAAMLYTIAAVHRVEALAMMTVSDLVSTGESIRISEDELKRGVDEMMKTACRIAVED